MQTGWIAVLGGGSNFDLVRLDREDQTPDGPAHLAGCFTVANGTLTACFAPDATRADVTTVMTAARLLCGRLEARQKEREAGDFEVFMARLMGPLDARN